MALLGLQRLKSESVARAPNNIVFAHMAPIAARLLRVRDRSTKVVLMPHGPVSFSEEIMSDFDLRFGPSFLSGTYRTLLSYLEKRIFAKVDLVVVAAKEGVEAYFGGTGIRRQELLEVVSGVPEFATQPSKEEARAKLELDPNKIIVGYFGRYNTDKGYDYFRQEAQLLEDADDICLISAGTGPITAKDGKNYRNFGWRTDVHLLIAACDAVVIPNRSTYFDLLPLEALSMSRPVLASRTGGNKKLAELTKATILFDRDNKALSETIRRFSLMSEESRKDLENEARRAYDTFFCEEAFLRNHEILCEEINDFFKSR
jgi:glycosyltransferase involved in cell wall biosynthesis